MKADSDTPTSLFARPFVRQLVADLAKRAAEDRGELSLDPHGARADEIVAAADELPTVAALARRVDTPEPALRRFLVVLVRARRLRIRSERDRQGRRRTHVAPREG